jgi:hypothetical protein
LNKFNSDDSSQANVLLKVDDSLAADPVRRMICTPGQVTLLATGQSGLFQNIALRTLNRETKPLIVNYYKAASLFEPCESGNRRMISLSDETQRSIDFEDVEDVLFTMDQSFSIGINFKIFWF